MVCVTQERPPFANPPTPRVGQSNRPNLPFQCHLPTLRHGRPAMVNRPIHRCTWAGVTGTACRRHADIMQHRPAEHASADDPSLSLANAVLLCAASHAAGPSQEASVRHTVVRQYRLRANSRKGPQLHVYWV